jgi:hypothetical protein
LSRSSIELGHDPARNTHRISTSSRGTAAIHQQREDSCIRSLSTLICHFIREVASFVLVMQYATILCCELRVSDMHACKHRPLQFENIAAVSAGCDYSSIYCFIAQRLARMLRTSNAKSAATLDLSSLSSAPNTTLRLRSFVIYIVACFFLRLYISFWTVLTGADLHGCWNSGICENIPTSCSCSPRLSCLIHGV